MKKVRIAELKSKLSAHLREVRRGGALTVMDRDTPIACIVPYGGSGAPLVVRHPLPGAPKPGEVPLPPPLRIRTDVMELLAQERGER